MTDRSDTAEFEALTTWARLLQSELGISELPLDQEAVLGLAGVVAHRVVRPAAPLSTFLVGFAAGRRAASGVDPRAAVSEAIAVARALARPAP